MDEAFVTSGTYLSIRGVPRTDRMNMSVISRYYCPACVMVKTDDLMLKTANLGSELLFGDTV